MRLFWLSSSWLKFPIFVLFYSVLHANVFDNWFKGVKTIPPPSTVSISVRVSQTKKAIIWKKEIDGYLSSSVLRRLPPRTVCCFVPVRVFSNVCHILFVKLQGIRIIYIVIFIHWTQHFEHFLFEKCSSINFVLNLFILGKNPLILLVHSQVIVHDLKYNTGQHESKNHLRTSTIKT